MMASAGMRCFTATNSISSLTGLLPSHPPSLISPPPDHFKAPPLPNKKSNISSRGSRRSVKLCSFDPNLCSSSSNYSSCSSSVAIDASSREEDCHCQLQSPSSVSISLSAKEEEGRGGGAATAAAEEACGSSRFAANFLRRRRGFILMATIPLLSYHTVGCDASADELDSGEATVIRGELREVLSKAKAAGVLRLAFHDAGTFNMEENTGGMNGSIIYELDRLENAGLAKSIKVLDKSKKKLDEVLSVSWADLIAIAGSEAVSLCGGPVIPVKIGRIDSSVPDPPDQLPQESLDASALKKCFLLKGFSTQELVALSGAHTLGSKGFGNPYIFDNSYYNILLEKPWTSSAGMSSMIGLPSDRALVEDDECLRWIKTYAGDQAKFFDDFSRAYIKLVDSGASWR